MEAEHPETTEIVESNRYKHGKIYRLYVPGEPECYIGSTCWELRKRFNAHKYSYFNPEQKQTAACSIFALGEVHIELLEAFACDTKLDLETRERYWIERTPGAINKNVPTRSMKEERAANKEKYAAKCKEWREKNKEHVAAYDAEYKARHKEQSAQQHKAWAAANKDKIKANKNTIITCGVCGEQTSKGNKWRHDKKHK
jgi:hypothetical protein